MRLRVPHVHILHSSFFSLMYATVYVVLSLIKVYAFWVPHVPIGYSSFFILYSHVCLGVGRRSRAYVATVYSSFFIL